MFAIRLVQRLACVCENKETKKVGWQKRKTEKNKKYSRNEKFSSCGIEHDKTNKQLRMRVYLMNTQYNSRNIPDINTIFNQIKFHPIAPNTPSPSDLNYCFLC